LCTLACSRICTLFVTKLAESPYRMCYSPEECRHLGSYAVWLLQGPMFCRNVSPPSSV
jgi:hypothetical protein